MAINITANNCQSVIAGYLCSLPSGWAKAIASAICATISNSTIDCEEVADCFSCADFKECETLTSLSNFTIDGNQVCITYRDEHGTAFNRCFTMDDTEVVITADNALTKNTPTNVQWGAENNADSPLLHDTYINASTFRIFAAGTASDFLFNVTNANGAISGISSDVIGVQGLTTSGTGVFGYSSSNGIGVVALGTSGPGLEASSISGIASIDTITPVSTSTVATVSELRRQTSGTAANGIGGSLDFLTEASTGSNFLSNQLISKWSTATTASRVSQFIITGVNNAVTSNLVTLQGNGEVEFNHYGVGTFVGTPAYTLGVLADGSVIEYTPDAVPTITADNGLTMSTATNAQLGGTLIHNTTITTGSNNLTIVTSVNGINPFTVNATTGDGVVAFTTSGTSVSGIATSGVGVLAQTTSGGNPALQAIQIPTSTNSVVDVITLTRLSSGTAANGIGGSLTFITETTTGAGSNSNQLISKWTDATNATRTSQFIITGIDSASASNLITLDGNGTVNFNHYGAGTITGSETYLLGVTSAGKVVEVDESFFITTVVQNGLSTVDGDGEVVELGSPDLTGAPLLHDTYISGAFNLSLQDGTLTVGTSTPYPATVTTRNENTSDLWSLIGVKSNSVTGSTSVNIGVEGQMIITGGTSYTGDSPIGGMYGELAFLGSGTWSFDGGQKFVQLSGLSGVVTMYTDDSSNYTSGNSIFTGGQYWMNPAGSGVIDKFASVRAMYPVPTPGLSFTGSITNYYGLFIDDYTEGPISTTQLTNRWGVYQKGAGESNQFNGKMFMPNLGNFANDGAAATGGVAVGQLYRNGSVVMVRVS